MAALPFPIPDVPLPAEKTHVTFAFPPYATRTRARAGDSQAVSASLDDARAKEPLFRVPAWLPVPVEGAAYFIVGALIGTFLMLTVVTLIGPLRPAAPAAAAPRALEASVRQASITRAQTAPRRAPAPMIEPTPPSTGPSLPLRTAARLPSGPSRPSLRR